MLEYKKRILRKVSFDLVIFENELNKAINRLPAKEIDELRSWCYGAFSCRYFEVFNRSFFPDREQKLISTVAQKPIVFSPEV